MASACAGEAGGSALFDLPALAGDGKRAIRDSQGLWDQLGCKV